VACFEAIVARDACNEGEGVVVRRGHLIAVVRAFLIGCAFLLLAVGCSGTSSETSKKEQGHSPKATASEEARCEGTRRIVRYGKGYLTNDIPGCPKRGLLLGTAGQDDLQGMNGDDKIRGLGGEDGISGGYGSDTIYGGPGNDPGINGGYGNDTIYGGPGNDFMKAGAYQVRDPVKSKDDVLYGGPGNDEMEDPTDGGDDVLYGGDGDDDLFAGKGEDVEYGGDGNDSLGDGNDGQRDKLYCGKGKDTYMADKKDYVDSSCEKKFRGVGGAA
jgi:hypothetical protein